MYRQARPRGVKEVLLLLLHHLARRSLLNLIKLEIIAALFPQTISGQGKGHENMCKKATEDCLFDLKIEDDSRASSEQCHAPANKASVRSNRYLSTRNFASSDISFMVFPPDCCVHNCGKVYKLECIKIGHDEITRYSKDSSV